MSRWARRLLSATLLVGILSVAVVLGASSVRTWMDQNHERSQAQHVATELEARIVGLEHDIARRTSDESIRRAALCYGPYVEPGTEVYAIAGLHGCVGPQTLR